MSQPEPLLWLDDHRGIYIPRDFATSFLDRDACVTGVDPEDWAILESGPDHDLYWDVWTEVCDYATVTIDGVTYNLYQDGTLWLVPDGMEWSDEDDFFRWPSDESDDESDDESNDESDDESDDEPDDN